MIIFLMIIKKKHCFSSLIKLVSHTLTGSAELTKSTKKKACPTKNSQKYHLQLHQPFPVFLVLFLFPTFCQGKIYNFLVANKSS